MQMSPEFGRSLEYVGSVGMMLAGGYLWTRHSVAEPIGGGQSWFEVIAHGIGIFFVSAGLVLFGRTVRAAALELKAAERKRREERERSQPSS